MILTVYQIYFDEKSKINCFDEWGHYDNSEKLTAFFENTVILDLIDQGKHKQSDYFAVFSHDIRKEIHFKEWLNNNTKLTFNPQSLEFIVKSYGYDVYAFEKRRQNKNIIFQAERYHPGFIDIINEILRETKFMDGVPNELSRTTLHNHFIMRSEIYQRYVDELLRPAMKIMESIPAVWQDAKYIRKLPLSTQERFEQAFGKRYYPYHPFVCERLPSLFLEKYKKEYSFRHIF